MKRLFAVEFTGWIVVAAEGPDEAESEAESAMHGDPSSHLEVTMVDALKEGDPLPGDWTGACLPYGNEADGDVTIAQFFARERAAKAAADALKLDPAAAAGDLFAGVPPLPRGEG
jgi:hypothetical protein